MKFSSARMAFLGLLGLLFIEVVLQVRSAFSWGPESWPLTDFLIDYSGGFVRRGLPGSLVWWVSSLTGIQANHIVIFFGFFAFLLLFVWMLSRLRGNFHPALLISCVALGIPAYQDGILRKDCLGLLVMIFAATVISENRPRGALLLAVAASTAAVLSHETFFFYGVAGLILLRAPDTGYSSLASIFRRLLFFGPAFAAFIASILWHGDEEVVRSIQHTWSHLWQESGGAKVPVGEAFKALGWTKAEGMHVGASVFLSGWYQTTAWCLVYGMSFMLVLLFVQDNQKTAEDICDRARMATILMVQLVLISPLFILGMDYGRWLFFWVVSSMTLLYAGFRGPSRIEGFFHRVIIRIESNLHGGFLSRLAPMRAWLLFFFGVPTCWNAVNFMTASPAGRSISRFLGY